MEFTTFYVLLLEGTGRVRSIDVLARGMEELRTVVEPILKQDEQVIQVCKYMDKVTLLFVSNHL